MDYNKYSLKFMCICERCFSFAELCRRLPVWETVKHKYKNGSGYTGKSMSNDEQGDRRPRGSAQIRLNAFMEEDMLRTC